MGIDATQENDWLCGKTPFMTSTRNEQKTARDVQGEGGGGGGGGRLSYDNPALIVMLSEMFNCVSVL
nr:unnamed protein product [Callosobruchus analis]